MTRRQFAPHRSCSSHPADAPCHRPAYPLAVTGDRRRRCFPRRRRAASSCANGTGRRLRADRAGLHARQAISTAAPPPPCAGLQRPLEDCPRLQRGELQRREPGPDQQGAGRPGSRRTSDKLQQERARPSVPGRSGDHRRAAASTRTSRRRRPCSRWRASPRRAACRRPRMRHRWSRRRPSRRARRLPSVNRASTCWNSISRSTSIGRKPPRDAESATRQRASTRCPADALPRRRGGAGI